MGTPEVPCQLGTFQACSCLIEDTATTVIDLSSVSQPFLDDDFTRARVYAISLSSQDS